MNTSEQSAPARKPRMSAEAVIGTGITIGALGVMFLLLGWAQSMRGVASDAWILFAIGGVMLVGGGLMTAFAQSGQSSDAGSRAAASDSPTAQEPNKGAV